MIGSTKAETWSKKKKKIKTWFWTLQLCNSNAHKMHKLYLSEWKFNLKSFVFISINVIILLSSNNNAIIKQNINAYSKALEMYLA